MHMNNMKMLINDKFEILILKFFIKYLFLMLIFLFHLKLKIHLKEIL